MVGEMNETNIPAHFVESSCATAITDGAGGHQRVQQDHCLRTGRIVNGRKKFSARCVVSFELSRDRAAPCKNAVTVTNCTAEHYANLRDQIGIGCSAVILPWCEPLAFRHVLLHLLATASVSTGSGVHKGARRA